ncbi:hypothetical protein [Serratia sp. DD3]|uniref:hypothetical protein n=1 Tax=Serratia sp. DD3 TaxID=1410619 RepID=UPI0003C4F4D1|nr:hypothetical protein [Serratia sp. DD3]KEY57889.1 hypothetical protein SRDD_32010 [Serratia sp. DD3]
MKIIIFLRFFIFLFFVSFFARSSCIESQQTSQTKQISLAKVKEVNNSERAYFYKYANGVCKEENLFIIPGDRVIAYKNLNGYDYVAYLTKNGDTVSGWIENNRLFDVEQTAGDITYSDFFIKIDGVNVYIGQPTYELKSKVSEIKNKKIELNYIGNNNDSNVFGVDFPFNNYAVIYISDLNHIIRNDNEEVVSQIVINFGGDYSTSRGIKIGDSVDSVIKKYGGNGVISNIDGEKSITYQYADMIISFNINSAGNIESIWYNMIPWIRLVDDLKCSRNINLSKPISNLKQCD